MEFCCEEKFTAKQEFVESETKKYEFEEETEIVEDFGKVPSFGHFERYSCPTHLVRVNLPNTRGSFGTRLRSRTSHGLPSKC